MATINITSESIKELSHVGKTGIRPGKYPFPDFLIIGPQRTGTSWLHKNLQFHPEILLPRQKELFFFSNLKLKELNKTYSSDELKWYLDKFRLLSLNGLQKILYNILVLRTLRMPRVFGEATASYAVMGSDLINEIFLLNPDVKIILFIRNPVERAWSNAKRKLIREKGLEFDQVPFSEFENLYRDENQIRGGEYSKIILKWQQFVRPDNMFVGSFDDIRNAPEGLLTKVFEFLNVSTDRKYLKKDARKVINPTMQKAIPEDHFRLLMSLHKEELEEIERLYGKTWY